MHAMIDSGRTQYFKIVSAINTKSGCSLCRLKSINRRGRRRYLSMLGTTLAACAAAADRRHRARGGAAAADLVSWPILTVDAQDSIVEAVAVRDGKISAGRQESGYLAARRRRHAAHRPARPPATRDSSTATRTSPRRRRRAVHVHLSDAASVAEVSGACSRQRGAQARRMAARRRLGRGKLAERRYVTQPISTRIAAQSGVAHAHHRTLRRRPILRRSNLQKFPRRPANPPPAPSTATRAARRAA